MTAAIHVSLGLLQITRLGEILIELYLYSVQVWPGSLFRRFTRSLLIDLCTRTEHYCPDYNRIFL